MKVGDLVTLSIYGSGVKRTSWVQIGDVGIVTKVLKDWQGNNKYAVRWVKSRFLTGIRSWHHALHFDRKDLKFARKNENR
tara:strand:- start:254 stop:493 length:240 start_codon:yes stop_codon:yes gene_type:complete